MADRVVIQQSKPAAPIKVVDPAAVGPTGPPGPPGPRGKPEFAGQGPPGTIVGSYPGAQYLDELTGEIYTLGG